MDDFKNSVMVTLLPTNSEWCKIELPHMTLVYAGEIENLKASAFNDIAKDASLISMTFGRMDLKISGIEIFGDEDKVQVFTFDETPELQAMRKLVESWDASEYAFNPHATIGPIGSFDGTIPPFISFNRIMVGWGEEQLTFWLK